LNSESTGTRERKRATKAMPPRLESQSPGCFVAMLVYLGVCSLLFWQTRWWLWIGLAGPAAIGVATLIARALRGRILLAECRRVFSPRGVRFLVVYSESPTWEAHIREAWLPRFGQTAVLLNWTERARWESSLEVRLFKHFIKSWRNFNPAVLVLRGHERPLVYRFFYAFQQARNGRAQYLSELEEELFKHMSDSTEASNQPLPPTSGARSDTLE
jgi:hypothetical protein